MEDGCWAMGQSRPAGRGPWARWGRGVVSKFRKKPVVIEAEQYSQQRHNDEGYLPEGLEQRWITDEDGSQHEGMPHIKTLEGDLRGKAESISLSHSTDIFLANETISG